MKLSQSILFSISVALLIIGVHQTFQGGFQNSYWIFMISLALLFLNQLLFPSKKEEQTKTPGRAKRRTSKKRK